MSDTSAKFAALVAERHRQMTPQQRLEIAAAMFDTAREIVDASLPRGLTREQRRAAIVRRIYGAELSDAAVNAFAAWPEDVTFEPPKARPGAPSGKP